MIKININNKSYRNKKNINNIYYINDKKNKLISF